MAWWNDNSNRMFSPPQGSRSGVISHSSLPFFGQPQLRYPYIGSHANLLSSPPGGPPPPQMYSNSVPPYTGTFNSGYPRQDFGATMNNYGAASDAKRRRIEIPDPLSINTGTPSPNKDRQTETARGQRPYNPVSDRVVAHEAMAKAYLATQARLADRNTKAASAITPPESSPPPLPDGLSRNQVEKELKEKLEAMAKEKSDLERKLADTEKKMRADQKKFNDERAHYVTVLEEMNEEKNSLTAKFEADLESAKSATTVVDNNALVKENERLRRQSGIVEGEIGKARTEMRGLQEENITLERNNEKLKHDLDWVRQNAEAKNEQFQNLCNSVKILEQENSNMAKNVDSLTKQRDELVIEHAAMQKQVEDLTSELQIVKKNRVNWQNKSDERKVRIDECDRLLIEWSEKYNGVKKDLNEKKKELSDTKKTLANATKELGESKKELEDTKAKLQTASEGNNALSKHFIELKNTKKELSDAKMKMEALKTRLPMFLEIIKRLKDEKEELKIRANNDIQKCHDEMKTGIFALAAAKLNTLGTENASLNEQIERRNNDIELLEQSRVQLQDDLDKQRERCSQLSQQLEEQQDELKATKDAMRKVEADLKKEQRISESLKANNRELKMVKMESGEREDAAKQKEQLDEFKEKLERAAVEIGELTRSVEEKIETLGMIEAEKRSLESKVKEAESQVGVTKKQYRKLQVELVKMTTDRNRNQLTAMSLDQKVQRQADVEAELRSEIARIKTQLETAGEELNRAKADSETEIRKLMHCRIVYVRMVEGIAGMGRQIEQFVRPEEPMTQDGIRRRLQGVLQMVQNIFIEANNTNG